MEVEDGVRGINANGRYTINANKYNVNRKREKESIPYPTNLCSTREKVNIRKILYSR